MTRLFGKSLFTLSVAAACFALAVASVEAAKADPAQAAPIELIAWRLPASIVVHGSPDGGSQLQEAAGSIKVEGDGALGSAGNPAPFAKEMAAILSKLETGRIEIKNNELALVGIGGPEAIAAANKAVEALKALGIKTAQVQLSTPDKAPFHWAAERSTIGAHFARITHVPALNKIELSGFVESEAERTKLIGIARELTSDPAVVDRMTLKSAVPASGAAPAALSQLSLLESGFVWIYGNKFDLVGAAHGKQVHDSRAACLALAKVLPSSIECEFVSIALVASHGLRDMAASGLRNIERKVDEKMKGWRGVDAPSSAASGESAAASPQGTRALTGAFAPVAPLSLPKSAAVESSTDPRTVDILYATVRKQNTADTSLFASYTAERSETLNYGRARVRVPDDHKQGKLELPGGYSIFGYQLTHETPDQKKHFIMRSCEVMTQEQWDRFIESVGPSDALIFVHGFNNSFDDAVFRFAQISWDLQHRGLNVLYSWASKAGVTDYGYDLNSAGLARDGFLKLLANLSEKHGISKVHVIAHSMGNYLVLDALAHRDPPKRPLGQLVMAAPDIDRDQFAQAIPKVKAFFRGLTLYASKNDWALALSKRVAGGVPRAGDVLADGPIVLAGLDSIDVSALGEEMFGLNHNTFAEARPLIDDISALLQEGRLPPRLKTEYPMPEGAKAPTYWRFIPEKIQSPG
jgi:esterase/lipase superfamily enzyme